MNLIWLDFYFPLQFSHSVCRS